MRYVHPSPTAVAEITELLDPPKQRDDQVPHQPRTRAMCGSVDDRLATPANPSASSSQGPSRPPAGAWAARDQTGRPCRDFSFRCSLRAVSAGAGLRASRPRFCGSPMSREWSGHER
jgi:hypothetical protein